MTLTPPDRDADDDADDADERMPSTDRQPRCEWTANCTDTSPHSWGQYSSFFSVPSEISPDIPDECDVTFALVLSRHGARDPTSSKSDLYRGIIERIQSSVSDFSPGFEFLKDFEYKLGSEQLTEFGTQQMVDSGERFYQRYQHLAKHEEPFVRAAGSQRVIDSATNFTKGYYEARGKGAVEDPRDVLVVPEGNGSNNTMDHGTCTAFEEGPASKTRERMQSAWKAIWVLPITARLNHKLPGANLTLDETIYMMDLCPFHVVASPKGDKLSPICSLFSKTEWRSYDYFMSLDKWYGYGQGNPLGPTQGVGYVNELIARLTGKPVEDSTSTNSTLDSSPETFPLDRKLYADFSHDNLMASVHAALGLYNQTANLPVDRKVAPEKAGGFSAAWTVPFAGRMYVEKMRCGKKEEEFEANYPQPVMVSTAGGIVIAIIVIALAAAVGWVVFTQLRARRLGLPPPSLSSYLPWKSDSNSYGPPRPAPGGVIGWVNDQIRKFRNRNNRSAAGAYETPLHGSSAAGRRGFGPLDPDEAWDTRVGAEADGYGPYDEAELGGVGRGTEYAGANSYTMNVPEDSPYGGADEQRGRTGAGAGGLNNPFDDDAAASMRGVSPRPLDTAAAARSGGQKRTEEPDSAGSSPTERRSVFRENV
ncbi:histidine phosphatase superfamily (branch 2) domain-containing protein [Sarocladium implicatum]|nr:histidine phosphatase superfamily (branch 2) domain-containing protein [Sarocladium implicatum]